jgi:hypothetical protein
VHVLAVLASRPPEWDRQRFTAWWRGRHAERAKQLPGLLACAAVDEVTGMGGRRIALICVEADLLSAGE